MIVLRELELVLPWPSRDLSPNARGGWHKRARAAKADRQQAVVLAHEAGWRNHALPDGRLHLHIDFYPPTRMRPDDDNMLARFKPARDGLAQVLGIDDRRFVSHPYVHSEPRPGGQVVVRLVIDQQGEVSNG